MRVTPLKQSYAVGVEESFSAAGISLTVTMPSSILMAEGCEIHAKDTCMRMIDMTKVLITALKFILAVYSMS